MRKLLKLNIMIVGLDERFNTELSGKLAADLEMYHVNLRSLVEYDIMDSESVLKLCGEVYYRNVEKKVLKKAIKFENTVLDVNYDLFINNVELFADSTTILYIKFSEKVLMTNDPLIKISFRDRDRLLSKYSDFVILNSKKDIDCCIKSIYSELGGEIS